MGGPTTISRNPPLWASQCKECQGIWSALANPESAPAVSFGSFKEALSTSCPNHKPLVQAFVDYVGHEEIEESPSKDVGIVTNGDVTITESITELGIYRDLLLVKKPSDLSHPGLGYIVDSEWVDLDLLKKWKRTCIESHGQECRNPFKIQHQPPSWMIDVEQRCLVEGDVSETFVALSYGDGTHRMATISRDTLAELQKLNAFDDPDLSIILTPIIRHAMHITSVMGERYLWVNTLWLTTPDEKVEAEYLTRMGEIFASAIITIIGADSHFDSESRESNRDDGDGEVKPSNGDAVHGLSGLKGVSNPRRIDQTVIPFGDEKIIFRNSGSITFTFVSGLPYYSQGWAYQQLAMSSRKVLFSSNEMHWECRCATWHEEIAPASVIDHQIDPKLKIISAGFLDTDALGGILSNYNDMTLPYDNDIVPAISSLLLAASRTFKGGFLYGAPEMFFEHALTWFPQWDHTQLQRRVVSRKNPAANEMGTSSLPSWSWMGWRGLISFGYGEAVRINDRVGRIEESTPITEWYTSKSPSDPPSQRRRISSAWYQSRDGYKDFTKPTPAGWTRHDTPTGGDEPHLYPDGCGEYVFTNDNLPDTDEGTKSWYYPVPVVDVQNSTPAFMPKQTQYLYCETNQVYLSGYRAEATEDMKSHNCRIDLLNASKKKIGSMQLHNSELLYLFPTSRSEEGFPVELVAVCKKSVYSNTWDEEKEMSVLPRIREDIYSVLWVEWNDGVAYRRAGGSVTATEWEKSGPEAVSLILG